MRFFFMLDGTNIQWFGKVSGDEGFPHFFNEKEYTLYREEHPVEKTLYYDEDEAIVRTKDGYEERWLKPNWVLKGRRLMHTEQINGG